MNKGQVRIEMHPGGWKMPVTTTAADGTTTQNVSVTDGGTGLFFTDAPDGDTTGDPPAGDVATADAARRRIAITKDGDGNITHDYRHTRRHRVGSCGYS